MTGLFEVLAHEDHDGHRNVRHATVAAKAQFEEQYGSWVRQDPNNRLAHLTVQQPVNDLVRVACQQFGIEDTKVWARVATAVFGSYRPVVPVKTAATEHESARMPRMCPFHKDVTEISLNSGDPAAGFSAMAQHWGGPRHCEGEDYEGDSCKFKPQMTTQSWWDQRAEKQEQRKKEREQAAELEAQQQTEIEQAEAEFAEPLDQETEVPVEDNVIQVDFNNPQDSVDTNSGEAAVEIPMSMAAKVAGGDEGVCSKCGATTFDGNCSNPKCPNSHEAATGDDKTGLGGPEPKMDKSKWSPKGPIDTDDEDGRHPTKRKDIVESVKADNNSWPPKEIGEQVTERQDVTKKVDNISGDGTSTWTEGPKTAISATDPSRNPIIDMMAGDYDGFTPQHVIDQAIVSHKRR